MGVRGLTSYIARRAETYLVPYELHDCNLVIDGDNLACNLYKDVTGTYSAFGGDYDDYYRGVVEFFTVLAECKVRAYVLMDGGYENRKLRTVAKRLRGKIAVIKRINPCGSIPVFPLHMKEVFIDAVRDCGVPVMRCIFEADDELAALSRKLRCPVLSYDSDFYIHNVRYIPLITLTVKAHTKSLDKATNHEERKLRKCEARRLEKRTKSHKVMDEIQVDNVERRKGRTYKYLDCCMYRIENLIARGSLSKEKLPLFAALLGNDYIARGAFKNFFNLGLGKAGRSRKMQQQQRRIKLIIKWLKTETAETALQKILGRLQKGQRASLISQVEAATSGYSNEKCVSYDYFVANYEHAFQEFLNEEEEDELELEHETEENTASESSEEDEEVIEEEEEQEVLESQPTASGDEVNDSGEEEEDNPDESDASDAEAPNEQEEGEFPAWFLAKLYPANLSRFFVDLMHLKKYINSPQIEHYPYPDCHEVAVPILRFIFMLLNSVETVQVNQPTAVEAGTDLETSLETPLEFTYLTRAPRVTNIKYVRYPIESTPTHPFDPAEPDASLLSEIFTNISPSLDAHLLFDRIHLLPKDLQLYFLAIVYWLQKSQHCDLLHLQALIICLVVLRTIDSRLPAERDPKAFQKRFGKIIKKERLVRAKEVLEGTPRTLKAEIMALSIPARMEHVPKSDCLLVQEQLLPHFHMQELFKKKYDLFSTIVLHGFAEFQSIAFQLHALNALLDFPYASPHMGQLYCGVFLYNIYDLLRTRLDVSYYVENFIFNESPMMFDFYRFLVDWCGPFIPPWKLATIQQTAQAASKKVLKKQRQKARKEAAKETAAQTTEMGTNGSDEADEDDFFDINNKFCSFLKISNS